MLSEEFKHATIEGVQNRFPWAELPGCWEIGPGWVPLVETGLTWLDHVLTSREKQAFQVRDVKEKWGLLRVDTQGLPERYDSFKPGSFDFERWLEELSAKTCMLCGEPGTYRTDGWMRTLCDRCEEERLRT